MMKKWICGILAAVLMVTLCACDVVENVLEAIDQPAKSKTFTVEDLTIDLTDDFFRMDMLAQDYDFCISSEDIVIFGLKVNYAEYNMVGISAMEYAQSYQEVLSEHCVSELSQMDEVPIIQYTGLNTEGEYQNSFIAIYEAKECFWLLEFVFESEDYAQLYPLLEQYAASVRCG